jgi:hypothetical protein
MRISRMLLTRASSGASGKAGANSAYITHRAPAHGQARRVTFHPILIIHARVELSRFNQNLHRATPAINEGCTR